MADEPGGEAAPVETNALQPERNYETEAADMGWTPKDQWKGDPNNWKDAKTYVEHGADIVRITKAQLKAQEKDFAARLEKMEKVNAKTVEQLQKAHDKELADLKAQRREAIKAGDVDKAEKLDDQIDDLKDDAPKAKLTGAALDKHNQKVQEEWVGKQDWWDTDEEMTGLGDWQKPAHRRQEPRHHHRRQPGAAREGVGQEVPRQVRRSQARKDRGEWPCPGR
jgi:hypothetical protein